MVRVFPISSNQPNEMALTICNSISRKLKGKKADVSSVSPSSERLEELWAVRGFICRKWSYAIGGNMVTRKQE